MMIKKKLLTGYVTNNQFNEKIIPIPYQNLIMRTYCNDNDLTYILPFNELVFKNNYSQLHTLINQIDKNTAIICCSLHMLPKSLIILKKITNLMIKKKTYIYFVYENLYLSSNEDMEEIEFQIKLSKINQLISKSNIIKQLI